MLAGGHRQSGDVIEQRVAGLHGAHIGLHRQQFFAREHLLDRVQRVFRKAIPKQRHLRVVIGIADGQAHHEAIHLRVGEELRARRADVVLRRDDDKGLFQRMRLPVHGDLPLLHRFQQRGLRFAGGTVDLVAQKQVGARRRALVIDELPALRLIHRKADDIRRHHVRRELYAAVAQIDGAGERHGQRGFAHAGHVVQQNVPFGQQRGEDMLDDPALAAHGLLHFENDGFKL